MINPVPPLHPKLAEGIARVHDLMKQQTPADHAKRRVLSNDIAAEKDKCYALFRELVLSPMFGGEWQHAKNRDWLTLQGSSSAFPDFDHVRGHALVGSRGRTVVYTNEPYSDCHVPEPIRFTAEGSVRAWGRREIVRGTIHQLGVPYSIHYPDWTNMFLLVPDGVMALAPALSA